jgi:nucleoside 2-deoxyribosyltransferase
MKLYFAGPDVFRPDVTRWAERVRTLCHELGHVALLPLDGEATTAAAIFRNNLELLAEADAVIANLNPFRGAEPDSGACVEIGYALALGKPVLGYADSLASLGERLQADGPDADGCYRDAAGWMVENFGLPFNLMIAVPVRCVEGGVEECLARLDLAIEPTASA